MARCGVTSGLMGKGMFVSEPNAQHRKPKNMTKRIAFLAGDVDVAQSARNNLVARYGNSAPRDADVIVALGGDGFMLSPIHCPGSIDDFVDHVIPELQRRGRVRTEYTGSTIRDHLRQTID